MAITCEEIDQMLTEAMPAASISVQGGDGHYEVAVVDSAFEGLNRVKRQQTIYRILNPHISSGAIHAVSMNLRTPDEAAA